MCNRYLSTGEKLFTIASAPYYPDKCARSRRYAQRSARPSTSLAAQMKRSVGQAACQGWLWLMPV